jgi:hypothetical protein
MWIYISIPPIRLHGVVLSYLSTGTTLPLSYIFNKTTNFNYITILICPGCSHTCLLMIASNGRNM